MAKTAHPPIPPVHPDTLPPPIIDAPGERTPDARTASNQLVADAIARAARVDAALAHLSPPAVHPDTLPPPIIDAPGERTPDARTASDQLVADATAGAARVDAALAHLSPPAVEPAAKPLPPVAPWGTKGVATPERALYDPAFDRRFTLDVLVKHPVAEVRQRAEEAQAAVHHGAPDAGIKMRAAMDVARRAERTR